ncbi:MAG: signal peptidase I [Candidatus Hydrothermarchaeaceae archaeon]
MPSPVALMYIVYLILVSIPLFVYIFLKYHSQFSKIWWKKRKRKKVNIRIKEIFAKKKSETAVTRVAKVMLVYLIIGYILVAKIIFFSVILSSSMSPTFDRGDLVLIQGTYTEPKLGDIILINGVALGDPENRELIIHRVIEISGEKIFTAGDATGKRDSWIVKEDMIQGKALTIFGKPIVVPKIGEYLIVDGSKGVQEITTMNNVLRLIKIYGLLIFLISLVIYAMLEAREIRGHRA